ncbi:hypothetical protein Ahu01nite_063770 [Winogradskya humida]|uniref:Alpha/beta hydrolase fold-3 domain-containing protein n=1 Tax=Winogradskya humida TaxID=113566 RepID=A0ABQ3ZXG2_9ACTN|nr:hypothetical protein Ahu01nite_063770 [Actinoplanes humidus]
MTAERDTVAAEADAFAARLAAAGVAVTHRRFPGVDHGFTHNKPAAVAREALETIVQHAVG